MNTSFSYVYMITNISTRAFYIGFRCKNVKNNIPPEEDIGVKYFTSGPLKSEFKSTPRLFEIDILFKSRGDSHDEAYWFEQRAIKLHISNPLCTNGFYIDPDTNKKTFSMHNRKHSEITKQKISASNKGVSRETHRAGKTWAELYGVERAQLMKEQASLRRSSSTTHPMSGKSHNNETKARLSVIAKARLPNRAVPVLIDNVSYPSIKEASRQLNVSEYILKKYYKIIYPEDVNLKRNSLPLA